MLGQKSFPFCERIPFPQSYGAVVFGQAAYPLVEIIPLPQSYYVVVVVATLGQCDLPRIVVDPPGHVIIVGCGLNS